MFKVIRGVYVHFLTLCLFAACFITGKLETLFITYIIMFLHELAHLLAAVTIGLKPSRIVFYPFGVNLKLKNKLVYSLSDELILYLSGPFLNLVLAIGVRLFFSDKFWFWDFYIKNIALAVLNLLPILPLDGGVITRKIIGNYIGHNKSLMVMRIFSGVMLAGGIYFISLNKFIVPNFSFYFFLIFLLGNLFTGKEKYNVDILRELAFYNRKISKHKTRVLVARKGENLRDLLKEFTNNSYNILVFIGENGEIEEIMSEEKVIGGLLAN